MIVNDGQRWLLMVVFLVVHGHQQGWWLTAMVDGDSHVELMVKMVDQWIRMVNKLVHYPLINHSYPLINH